VKPVGVVLAGGAGRRIGGDKATVELAGRPLLLYPLAAVRAVLRDVAVVAKRVTALPPLVRGHPPPTSVPRCARYPCISRHTSMRAHPERPARRSLADPSGAAGSRPLSRRSRSSSAPAG